MNVQLFCYFPFLVCLLVCICFLCYIYPMGRPYITIAVLAFLLFFSLLFLLFFAPLVVVEMVVKLSLLWLIPLVVVVVVK